MTTAETARGDAPQRGGDQEAKEPSVSATNETVGEGPAEEAVGEETFAVFCFGYLQACLSASYTLSDHRGD